MGLGKDYAGQNCAFARALEILGERWTLLVIRDAFFGVRRFGDFLVHLDVPRAVLSDRLETLVRTGVLRRQRYQDSPPRDEYLLTEAGIELWPPLFQLTAWGTRHLATGPSMRIFLHAGCGGTLAGPAVCTACNTLVAAEDTEFEPGPGSEFLRSDRVSVALRQRHRLLQPLELG
ncbi:winged helix-turn-helix transcriptional regulator [Cryptosporangium aurantiacum]|uniref:Transcriptional regulator, HxlR family n=1 Tax=Cryptosporangium aurantiacum TaxID=134849 RepID=A0A1M7RJ97_9ACTN|nr:helix-turn-helix domain-containing protein [Cryptosporangium aurantiacum]SHN46211.1 transcriptional regulator, HxlR family [Cryptosporangium aurantiacum]